MVLWLNVIDLMDHDVMTICSICIFEVYMDGLFLFGCMRYLYNLFLFYEAMYVNISGLLQPRG